MTLVSIWDTSILNMSIGYTQYDTRGYSQYDTHKEIYIKKHTKKFQRNFLLEKIKNFFRVLSYDNYLSF